MSALAIFSLTFAAGCLYESLCVLWVHHSERNEPVGIGWTTAVASLCTVTGVEGMVSSLWGGAGYVVGCTTGAVVAVLLKRSAPQLVARFRAVGRILRGGGG